MVGKLIKHEIKSYLRTLLPVQAIIVRNGDSDKIRTIFRVGLHGVRNIVLVFLDSFYNQHSGVVASHFYYRYRKIL